MPTSDMGLRAVLEPEIDEQAAQESAEEYTSILEETMEKTPNLSSLLPDRQQVRAGVGRAAGREIGGMLPGRTGTMVGSVLGEKLAGGGGGGGSRSDEGPSDAESGESLVDLAIDRNEYLEEIEEHLDPDGPSMGSGKESSGMKEELLGAVVETAGDAGIEMGDNLIDFLKNALGTTLGNVVADAIDVGGDGSGGSDGQQPPAVEKPEWVPIEVEDPGTVGVDAPDSIGVDDPSPLGVDDPSPLGVDDPSPLQVDDPSPLEVDDPSPLEVGEPDWHPLSIRKPDWLPITLQVPRGRGGGGQGSGEYVNDDDTGEISIGGESGINIGGGEGFNIGPPDTGINIGGDHDPSYEQESDRRGPPGSGDSGRGGGNRAASRERQTPNVDVQVENSYEVDLSKLQKELDRVQADAVEEALERIRREMEQGRGGGYR